MRIVLVSQEYPPETAHGGIATQTEAKARGLAALGHDVCVLSHSVSGGRIETERDGVRIVRIPTLAVLQTRTEIARWIAWSTQVAAELQAFESTRSIDIVDFTEYGAEGHVHLLNRAPWERYPSVIHLQGPLVMLAHAIGWPEIDSELYRIGTAMESSCLRLADAIVSSSRQSAHWVSRHYGVDASSIPIIHAGVDTSIFRPGLSNRSPRPTIVFAGRVAASKGADTLVDAACIVARRVGSLQVRLIGRYDDGFRSILESRARNAGHADLLEFTGALPRSQLPSELCRAHVFAAPSRYEGGPGFVYLEAMACGVPTIGCSGSGIDETIQNGVTGLLVPPDDVDALAKDLTTLLEQPSRAKALGIAGRKYVLDHCETMSCMRRYADFLESVMARGR